MNVGDVLEGRFQIERVAGKGGAGIVYRGLDRDTGAPVAIKTAQLHGAPDRRFEREAETLAALRHPSIVSYLRHGTFEDERYLVMEWLDGEDLGARLLATGGLALDDAVAVARQIAAALAAAHERGVVHRDVKPSNVFLVGGRADHVKLLDFGIARLAGPATLTTTGTVVGTPSYMAPEQARGASELDARRRLRPRRAGVSLRDRARAVRRRDGRARRRAHPRRHRAAAARVRAARAARARRARRPHARQGPGAPALRPPGGARGAGRHRRHRGRRARRRRRAPRRSASTAARSTRTTSTPACASSGGRSRSRSSCSGAPPRFAARTSSPRCCSHRRCAGWAATTRRGRRAATASAAPSATSSSSPTIRARCRSAQPSSPTRTRRARSSGRSARSPSSSTIQASGTTSRASTPVSA
jgi:predicted Ser/Thr protein kinase